MINIVSQRGFASVSVLLASVITSVALVTVGLQKAQETLVSNIKQSIESSTQVIQKSADLGETAATPSSEKVNPGSEKLQPESSSRENLVSSGNFQFSGNKVSYTFSIPKNGGAVSGSLGGVCKGAPEGNFNRENGKVEGVFKAKCSAGQFNLISTDIEIKYSGDVKENKVGITWVSVKPVSGQRGWFEIYFQ